MGRVVVLGCAIVTKTVAIPLDARMKRVSFLPVLASLRWTPILLVWLGLAAACAALGVASPTLLLTPPLLLLVLNLLVAIVANSTFRAKPSLLVFHVALLGVIVLAGVSRLTYLKGWVELAGGELFHGELMGVEQGPFHQGALERVKFGNEGFVKEYGANRRPRQTRNRVRWLGSEGVWHQSIIGDDRSLLLQGYRIYTSANHGFAPVFVWYPPDGSPSVTGAVHLPSFPRYQDQSNAWTIPGTDLAMLAMLLFDENPLSASRPGVFPKVVKHRLRVSVLGESRDLLPGERLELTNGRGVLLYLKLDSWMGYRFFYDWTRSWLLAAFLVAIVSLSWHFWQKFSVRSPLC